MTRLPSTMRRYSRLGQARSVQRGYAERRRTAADRRPRPRRSSSRKLLVELRIRRPRCPASASACVISVSSFSQRLERRVGQELDALLALVVGVLDKLVRHAPLHAVVRDLLVSDLQHRAVARLHHGVPVPEDQEPGRDSDDERDRAEDQQPRRLLGVEMNKPPRAVAARRGARLLRRRACCRRSVCAPRLPSLAIGP